MEISKQQQVAASTAVVSGLLLAVVQPFSGRFAILNSGLTVGGLTIAAYLASTYQTPEPARPLTPLTPKEPEKVEDPCPLLSKEGDRELAEAIRAKKIDPVTLRALGDVLLATWGTDRDMTPEQAKTAAAPLRCIPKDYFDADEPGQQLYQLIDTLRTKGTGLDQCVDALSLALWEVYEKGEKKNVVAWEAAEPSKRSVLWSRPDRPNPMMPEVVFSAPSAKGAQLVEALQPFMAYREAVGGLGYNKKLMKKKVLLPENQEKLRALEGNDGISSRFDFIVGKLVDYSGKANLASAANVDGEKKVDAEDWGSSSTLDMDPHEAAAYYVEKFSKFYALLPELTSIVEGIAKDGRPLSIETHKVVFDTIAGALQGAQVRNLFGMYGTLKRPKKKPKKRYVSKKLETLKGMIKPLEHLSFPRTAGLTPFSEKVENPALKVIETQFVSLRDVKSWSVTDDNYEQMNLDIEQFHVGLEELKYKMEVALEIIAKLEAK